MAAASTPLVRQSSRAFGMLLLRQYSNTHSSATVPHEICHQHPCDHTHLFCEKRTTNSVSAQSRERCRARNDVPRRLSHVHIAALGHRPHKRRRRRHALLPLLPDTREEG